MARSFSIKQIAAQSGVSKATVDRALHQRGSVSPRTARRIAQAIRDLELQQRASLASGRTLPIDLVMHAPERFSSLVLAALLSQINSFAPFRLTLRCHIFEEISPEDLQRELRRCGNDSYGVLLKASDHPLLKNTIAELAALNVPVVTLVTDLPSSERISYVGMDNDGAGRTAAWLMSRWLPAAVQTVAVVISSTGFRGEEQRMEGFIQALSQRAPYLKIKAVSEGYGIDSLTFTQMCTALEQDPSIQSIYSVGGGNGAILQAFSAMHREVNVFIGHDLDEENRRLLAAEEMDAVIDHDLHEDARSAFKAILRFHGFLPEAEDETASSRVIVVTPFNI
ncbi:LacI family DNA-binding transcriptional regulator [Pantoea trifolii]|uniref:LacI family DNA-binding transcriptional regulator n=1 Tax=Pantoea trifolii TaxID=2968030 RepID=A0ABT1VQN8_9GAMM|nr:MULTISPECIES: LacI family DNA-binding transcriptional regulator [unclassified Pantoea]MCQ8229865.1 LacI family DNA-binding transcriptional regulator [Pantoea sp. MMK2]MCQ8238581.1 LacI family DNA-binding transcriptional regulator [Pantoea sp. MMK3]